MAFNSAKEAVLRGHGDLVQGFLLVKAGKPRRRHYGEDNETNTNSSSTGRRSRQQQQQQQQLRVDGSLEQHRAPSKDRPSFKKTLRLFAGSSSSSSSNSTGGSSKHKRGNGEHPGAALSSDCFNRRFCSLVGHSLVLSSSQTSVQQGTVLDLSEVMKSVCSSSSPVMVWVIYLFDASNMHDV